MTKTAAVKPAGWQLSPGLIAQQGSLSKEVSFEQVVDLAGTLGGGLVHHRLSFLDDIEQVTRVTLHHSQLNCKLVQVLQG